VSAERVRWGRVLEEATRIVHGYRTGVTLRQLFYRLVAAQLIPNTISAYKGLSARTAEARREGSFPSLFDQTRSVRGYQTFDSVADALEDLPYRYRKDRTAGQEFQVWVGVEKHALEGLMFGWFGDLGVPVVALGGYASQSYVDDIAHRVASDGRKSVLVYAGDFDPSGEDISRDFEERSDCFDDVVRVALDADQVRAYGLPPAPGKATDPRAASFAARHGALIQVELDALDPNDLQRLYHDAIDDFWDMSTFEAVVARETRERDELVRIAQTSWDEEDDR
jgi:hypothetical protein